MKNPRSSPLLTDKQKQEILKLYEQGYGTPTIGRLLKVSIQRTTVFLKEQGLTRDRITSMLKRAELDKKKLQET